MTTSQTIQETLAAAQKIVIIQADNPDADSLASSLALEAILQELGKDPVMYCGVNIPQYLLYLPGADRVVNELPHNFDAAIMVDCASILLLDQLEKSRQILTIKSKPFIVIDHHETEINIPFKHIAYIDEHAVATGEVIYNLAKELKWPLPLDAQEFIASSIMADSLGLSIEGIRSHSVYILAELVEAGVDLAKLDALRRSTQLRPKEIIAYKAKLLERIRYELDDQLALVTIPWDEIQTYSPIYNPGVLALEELRFAKNVKIAIAIKTYPDGKITAKIRCNHGCTIANSLAEKFGGGGHPGAAGFKTFDWKLDELVDEIISQTNQLLS